MAVTSQDGYKKGGCPVIISCKRGAVIVLIANIVDQNTPHYIGSDYSKRPSKVFFSRKKTKELSDNCLFEGAVPELLSKEGAVHLDMDI